VKTLHSTIVLILLSFGWLSAQADAKPESLAVQILDSIEHQPLAGAAVTWYLGDSLLGGVMTDEKGIAVLPWALSEVAVSEVHMVVRYAGKQAQYAMSGSDETGYKFEFDPGFELEKIVIASVIDPVCILPAREIRMVIICIWPVFEPTLPYRPLDEFLMMNFSEIHHSGRW
jgi:hypothetical protein